MLTQTIILGIIELPDICWCQNDLRGPERVKGVIDEVKHIYCDVAHERLRDSALSAGQRQYCREEISEWQRTPLRWFQLPWASGHL